MLHNALVSASNGLLELDLRSPSIARPLDRSFGRSVARSIIARSVARSLGRSIARSLARSLHRSIARSLDRSIARSIARSLDRSIARSIGWTVASKIPPSVGEPGGQPPCFPHKLRPANTSTCKAPNMRPNMSPVGNDTRMYHVLQGLCFN